MFQLFFIYSLIIALAMTAMLGGWKALVSEPELTTGVEQSIAKGSSNNWPLFVKAVRCLVYGICDRWQDSTRCLSR